MEKEKEREETLLPKQEAEDMETEKEVVFSISFAKVEDE